MCQATVYLTKEDENTELMRDVISIERVEKGLRLETFFGEPVTVRARIERIDLLRHTVTLVPEEVS